MNKDSMTAPTPSGGAAQPLTAEEDSAFLLRLANDLGTTHRIDDAGVHRRVFNLTAKACDRLREIAAALLAARRGEAELRATLHALVRPDNGYCNQCGGHWNHRLDGSWDYDEGYHTPSCRAALAATPEGP